MLTTRQAGEMVQIKPQSIRRWLARGQAHGVRTSGGPYRVCRNSLFVVKEYITPDQPQREDDFDDDRSLTFEGFHLLPPEPTR
jgi:hypothetical protein